jgi:polyhydroxybutyrate depolymerase
MTGSILRSIPGCSITGRSITGRSITGRLVTMICLVLVVGSCTSSSDETAATTGTSEPTASTTQTTTQTQTAPATDQVPLASTTEPSNIEPSTNAVECTSVEPGQHTFTLDAGGAIHDVQVFVPTSVDGAADPPLVLNWHGLGSNGGQQALFTGYEELAEAEGFVVVHPTGVPAAGDDRNSWELGQFDVPERDDVAFADALIDQMIEQYCVDESRVYSTGMSNGGLFTSFLVCELADRLAAASSVAGVTHHDDCNPGRAVPFIAFHGTADAVVPFDGTRSDSSLEGGDTPSAFFDQVMPDEFAEFAANMGCEPEARVDAFSADVTAHSYLGCDDDVPLIFYEIAEGGHTWPNTPVADLLPPQLGYTTLEIDATVDSWSFFEHHVLTSS